MAGQRPAARLASSRSVIAVTRKTVRRQPQRQPGILQPPLDQLADGFAGQRHCRSVACVRRSVERNSGRSLASAAMPAASR